MAETRLYSTQAPIAKARRGQPTMRRAMVSLLSAAAPALTAAQDSDCISLKGSTACPAFQSASISSTNETLTGYFPFLRFVSDRESFDNQLSEYVRTSYVQSKYQDLFGCGDIDLTNSSDTYARFTTTVLCNSVVQNSVETCKLSAEQSEPLCAETCAEFAQSEALVTGDKDLCKSSKGGLDDLIRADFINCALPEGALQGSSCIRGIDNEPENCGYGNSTMGLCSYCAAGGLNSTDTCCYNAKAEDRCKGVQLPSITSTVSLTTPTASSTSPPVAGGGGGKSDDNDGLSGGAIAGIVVGSLAALALIGALVFFCLRRRRRPSSPKSSIFNQPSPSRKGPQMSQSGAPQGYEVLPGGRIARMSALEGHSGDSPSHDRAASLAAGGRRKGGSKSSSDDFGDSPISDGRGAIRGPVVAGRRNGSMSSNSVLGSSEPRSPTSAGGFSSPQGVASQQSEQLPFFKDYYSSDDIHPGDRVAVLWAYQPRAADEFALERGDMLKVVGIWDDGWATGIMLDDRAEEWETRRQAQRDSGVSNASGHGGSSPTASGEIKAFPLVCVCLPEHWRKTIEGDGSTESGSNGRPPALPAMS